jgi:hypothetical protein
MLEKHHKKTPFAGASKERGELRLEMILLLLLVDHSFSGADKLFLLSFLFFFCC